MPALRTLAVHCEDWATTVLARPTHVPVAVVEANRVVAATATARAEGVVAGLRRREAQARCPSVELHDRDEAVEARGFELVLAALGELTPRLEVRDHGRCSMPTRGPSRYHGGDRALGTLVRQRVRSALVEGFGGQGGSCGVGVAVADGPRAAAILARGRAAHPEVSGVVVGAGSTAAALSSFPVEVLAEEVPAASELVTVLRRLGLRTVGRFAALAATDVVARFGSVGLEVHRLANGVEETRAELQTPAPDLRVTAAVDPPADRVDRVAFLAKSLADSFHAELAGRGLACTRVLIVAGTETGDRIERLWRHEGALSAPAIAQRMRWQLEGWLGSGRTVSRCTGGVDHLELVPDEVVPDDGLQLGFWGGSSEAGERAVRALARVQALVGSDAVLVPEPRGGRSPGERFGLVPLDAVDLAARTPRDPAPWPGRLPTPSPAVVLTRPEPVEVLDADGRRVSVGGRGAISAPPAGVRLPRGGNAACRGGHAVVRAWAGPWCIDERWWDATAHRRRARLQVVLAPEGDDDVEERVRPHPSRGSAHLLTLEDGRWWLEATYD